MLGRKTDSEKDAEGRVCYSLASESCHKNVTGIIDFISMLQPTRRNVS